MSFPSWTSLPAKVFHLWSNLRKWYAPILLHKQSINSLEPRTVSLIKRCSGSRGEDCIIEQHRLSLLQKVTPGSRTLTDELSWSGSNPSPSPPPSAFTGTWISGNSPQPQLASVLIRAGAPILGCVLPPEWCISTSHKPDIRWQSRVKCNLELCILSACMKFTHPGRETECGPTQEGSQLVSTESMCPWQR